MVRAGLGFRTEAIVAEQELEAAPFLGDAWFFRALVALGSGAVRLLETEDGRPLPRPPPLSDGTAFVRLLRVTDDGERVLSGEADRVELLGIDKWVGGTHMTSSRVWRWDSRAKRVVLP